MENQAAWRLKQETKGARSLLHFFPKIGNAVKSGRSRCSRPSVRAVSDEHRCRIRLSACADRTKVHAGPRRASLPNRTKHPLRVRPSIRAKMETPIRVYEKRQIKALKTLIFSCKKTFVFSEIFLKKDLHSLQISFILKRLA